MESLKKAQKEIDDLKSALDQSAIVAFTDAAGTITYVNDKFCEISKYSRKELIGNTHGIINSRYHPKAFFDELWKTIASGKTWKGEIKNKAKDGNYYWVFTTIVPFLDENGKPYQYVAIRTDITDLKHAQEDLEIERARIANAEKMASVGEMAAGIAHELGNPLATINGRMQLLEAELQSGNPVDAEAMSKTVQKVLALTDRMGRIIRGMRSLSRDGSNDPFHKVPIGRVLRDVMEFSSERFQRMGIRVEMPDFDETLQVPCQETQIGQVMVNLINNARDAIQNLPDKWIKIDLKDKKDAVELSVTDSGEGIPEEINDLIMKPFFTTKDFGKGSGLGLSICKNIIDKHKGSIAVDRESAHTRFVVTLPKTSAVPLTLT